MFNTHLGDNKIKNAHSKHLHFSKRSRKSARMRAYGCPCFWYKPFSTITHWGGGYTKPPVRSCTPQAPQAASRDFLPLLQFPPQSLRAPPCRELRPSSSLPTYRHCTAIRTPTGACCPSERKWSHFKPSVFPLVMAVNARRVLTELLPAESVSESKGA